MKQAILGLVVLTLGLSLSAGTTASPQTSRALGPDARCVDDPPPEPIDCPMCAGNAQLHARRLVWIQERLDCVALLAARW
jgi:hypothetical protein